MVPRKISPKEQTIFGLNLSANQAKVKKHNPPAAI